MVFDSQGSGNNRSIVIPAVLVAHNFLLMVFDSQGSENNRSIVIPAGLVARNFLLNGF